MSNSQTQTKTASIAADSSSSGVVKQHSPDDNGVVMSGYPSLLGITIPPYYTNGAITFIKYSADGKTPATVSKEDSGSSSTYSVTPEDRLGSNTYQGDWSAGTYAAADMVKHNSRYWVAGAETTEEPSDSASDWEEVYSEYIALDPTVFCAIPSVKIVSAVAQPIAIDIELSLREVA